METNAVDERLRFAHDFLSGPWSMTELCERYGVTRPTGYKWIARHRAGGTDALAEQSRAPHRSPHRTEIETVVLAARRQDGWGAKKLLQVLRTLHAVLERHGLLRTHRRPRGTPTRRIRSGRPTSPASSRPGTARTAIP